MSDPLYGKALLRLAAEANGAGRLAEFDAEGQAYNPSCGDRVSVTIKTDGETISAFAHETRACVLTQASASILGAHVAGADEANLRSLRSEVAALLQGD